MSSNSTSRMTVTKNYDYLNRMTYVGNATASGATPWTFGYIYNSANQRQQINLADGSRWSYGYDTNGQVISGCHYFSDNTPVAGEQFQYTFDAIGNRTKTLSGGDQNGNSLRSASYAYNNLNEYASRTVLGVFDVLGQANASASVTVNGAGTYRHAEFYQSPVNTTNGSGPVWQSVTVAGTAGSLAVTNTGHVLVHPTPENFWYDLPREIGGSNRNGWIRDFGWRIASWLDLARFISRGEPDNLLSDGCWTNTWDLPHEITDSSPVSDAALARLRRCWSERCVAISRGGENRLIAMQSVAAVPTNAWKKLGFAYDYMGRRTQKIVSTWNGSSFISQYTNLFLYHGWNLIVELNGANNSVIRSYIWGQDLSGSMQGAGGVGGLLAIKPAGADALFVATDANGNVAGLLDAANGTVAATYGYGPFGELIEMNSFLASPNPFWFSTKYYDDETDLIYYGHRYYSPGLGMWWRRDPLGERGGANLYDFCGNDAANQIDAVGLRTTAAQQSIINAALESIRAEYLDSPIAAVSSLGPSLSKLESVVPRIKTISFDPAQVPPDAVAAYIDFWNAIYFRSSNPYKWEVAHEMVHAYNNLVTGITGYRRDEGMAWAYTQMGHEVLGGWLITENNVRNAKSCSDVQEYLSDRWPKMWRDYGTPTSKLWAGGSYGSYWGFGPQVSFAFDSQDFTNVKENLGLHLSCREIAAVVNAMLTQRGCCTVVTCDQVSAFLGVIAAGVAIDPVLQ